MCSNLFSAAISNPRRQKPYHPIYSMRTVVCTLYIVYTLYIVPLRTNAPLYTVLARFCTSYILYLVACTVHLAGKRTTSRIVVSSHYISCLQCTTYTTSCILLYLVLLFILLLLYIVPVHFPPLRPRAYTTYCMCVHTYPLYIVIYYILYPIYVQPLYLVLRCFALPARFFACAQLTKQYTHTLQHARFTLCAVVHIKQYTCTATH